MIIRYATEIDMMALATVKNFPNPDISYETTRYRLAQMAEGRAFYLVAVLDDKIVGHAFLNLFGKPSQPDYPDIQDIYVHPEFRRLGIATHLVIECERLAHQHGFSHIGLAVGIMDYGMPARILYNKLGYKSLNTPPYVDGVYDGVKDWVIDMLKKLS
ncbi:MAG: GNAT family N-acetyltransferase [Anaerolineae bacterium]|nr:GNAT family N-acetyltransferase [Anaerolineae bacterium]